MSVVRVVHNRQCLCSESNIQVKDSYLIPNKEIKRFCEDLKRISPYSYSRSIDSWSKEIRAHNLLYKFNLFISHTADTDLNEDESKLRLTMYSILSCIQKLITRE